MMHPNDSKLSCTILTIGGCHSVGYPFANEHGFVDRLSRQLSQNGFAHKMVVKPYITLNKPEQIQKALHEVQPDIVLLQCGHFEFLVTSPLRRLLAWRNKNKSKTRPRPPADAVPPNGPAFAPGVRFRVLQGLKHLANAAFGYSFGNTQKWAQDIDASFKELHSYHPELVMVLEPFPTANRVTNRYREKGAALLEKYGKQYRFVYVAQIAETLHGALGKNFLVDEMHLNAAAHGVIAAKIADRLYGPLQHRLNNTDQAPKAVQRRAARV